MPDWTYQTVFRPLLFRLPAATARGLALGGIGTLGRLPGGRYVIQFMGHMATDPRLAVEHGELPVSSPVGLSCRFDPALRATAGLGEFGFGMLEIGPIVAEASPPAAIGLRAAAEEIHCAAQQQVLTAAVAQQRLTRAGPLRQRVLARLLPASSDEARQMIEQLAPYVDAYVVPLACWPRCDFPIAKPVLLAIGARQWQDETLRQQCLAALSSGAARGIVWESTPAADGSLVLGPTERAATLQATREVRQRLGTDPLLVVSTGVHCPADALDALDAGANWVFLDSGLVFAGPGLPKRIHEALLYQRLQRDNLTRQSADRPPAAAPSNRVGGQAWWWAALMGLAMLLGGVLAMIIATTRVVLPYDEAMAGLTREQLVEINSRLLDFMRHDRVTLAGTMLSVGILYLALSWFGIRRGLHWAWVALITSAFAGFASFFSFLGFGYFDPFHAFVTAILFQFLLLTIHSHLPARHAVEPPDLHNDWRWRLNQWGQLLFVVHGAVLLAAGCVISQVGMTSVFVPEDLEFMQTCAATLLEAHPRLVPLVAHDRATFGGMLVATGVATLLPALWGFRCGQAWLWWALMAAGNIAYLATIAVHWSVGYLSLEHLLPAYGGLALLWIGGGLSYPYLAGRSAALRKEWAARVAYASSV